MNGQMVVVPPPAPPPGPVPPPAPSPPVVTIPLPPSYNNAPKGPEGFWRNWVNIETGSSWGKKPCGQQVSTSTTTLAPGVYYPPVP